MCVIAYKPREIPIDMEVLKHCWEKNSDGAGLMFAENGKLKVAKGFMKWRSLRRYIKRRGIDTFTDLPVAFHFRIATHGSVNERNCHPFQINENLAMMHNGVIRKVDAMIAKDSDISDSEFFANRYVKDAFGSIGIHNLKGGEPINELFDEYIGASKLLFMDNTGDIAMVNERAGSWSKYGLGIDWWFSNILWKPVPKPSTSVSSASKGTSITRFNGESKVVESWENGRSVIRTYSTKTGALMSTKYGSYEQSTGFGMSAQDEMRRDHVEKFRPTNNAFELDDEDWYCLECHAFWLRSESKRSYWTNGMTSRIVECPECASSQTCDAEDLYAEIDKSDSPMYLCYLCGADMYEDELSISGTGQKRCAVCYSVNIYKQEERHLVERFGVDYFNAEVLERGAM